MTRKHFKAIAASFQSTKPNDDKAMLQWLLDVNAMANTLAQFNSLFDKDRFVSACLASTGATTY